MKFQKRCKYLYFILAISLFVNPVSAQEWHWSVSPLLGIYSPQLDDLYFKEFRAPLPGTGGIIVDGEASVNYNFTIMNSLDEIKFATEAGIEIQLEINDKVRLLLGFGSWEGGSTSVIRTEMPFQGELSRLVYERSARVSATQYFVGMRRNIISNNNKRLYVRWTLNEILDVDYNENLAFAFASGPADGFKRVVTMESQATGILMMQLGVGGEYFFNEWLSFGVDAGYMKSLDKSTLGNARSKDDFQIGDSLDLNLPARVGPDGRLWYLDANGIYQKMYVDFDGWRALFRINFYF